VAWALCLTTAATLITNAQGIVNGDLTTIPSTILESTILFYPVLLAMEMPILLIKRKWPNFENIVESIAERYDDLVLNPAKDLWNKINGRQK
jgi:hypothetical protein